MSTVYLAIQESVGRVVALKVMSPALNSDPSYSERFQREANIVGQLSHPHIVSIYDIGRHDNYNYIAMDYLPGGSIHDKMLEGINAQQALKILKEIGLALDHAHERGYIHRDIKPENILFRDDGSAVLTDFGVARAVAIGSRATHAGTVVGTPHYMSPEQTRGKTVDGRSDLYSLGIVFYEMLTGSVPYQGDEAVAIALKHLASPLPTLPAQYIRFQPILDKLLDKESSKRYQTGRELVADIEVLQLQMRKQGEEYLSSGNGLGRQFASLFSVLLRKTRSNLAEASARAWQFLSSLRYAKGRGFYRAANTRQQDISEHLTQQNTLVATRVHRQINGQGWIYNWRQIPANYRYLLLGAGCVFLLALLLLFLQSESPAPVKQTESVVIREVAPASDADERKNENEQGLTVNDADEQASESALPEALNQEQVVSTPADADAIAKQAELPPQLLEADTSASLAVASDITTATGSDSEVVEQASKPPALPVLQTSSRSAASETVTDTVIETSADADADADNKGKDNESALQTAAASSSEQASSDESTTSSSTSSAPAFYALTVNTEPDNARVRIMNIKEKYQDEMRLSPGRYHVEVTAPGHQKYLEWVTLGNEDLQHNVSLLSNRKPGMEFSDALAAGGSGPAMVVVPAGSFRLGGPDENSQPYQAIKFAKPFAISKYEVTFKEYEHFAQKESLPLPGDNKWGRDNRPVINVSWEEASEYARWLSQQTGERYRLPSEAEWEYVAKSGQNNAFWWGNDVRSASQKANCRRHCDSEFTGVFKSQTAPVGSFMASPFGVYDLAGNVAEWTADCYKDNYQGTATDGRARRQSNCPARVIRGGSMKDDANDITAFKRRFQPQHTLHEDVGIRLLRELR